VLKRNEDGSYLEAELQIGFQMISERYTSHVKLQAPHTVSSTVANSALFHHLESTWQMKPGPNPNSTWLSFSVDFAFLNPLYANVAQLFFSEVVTRMMGAFEGRCKQLYGPPLFSPAGQKHLTQQQRQQQQRQQKLEQPRLQLHHQHKHQPTMETAKRSQALEDLPQVAAAGLATGSSAGAVVPAAAAAGHKPGQQQQQQGVSDNGWHDSTQR
jgi:ribosome-associated toxin RatA of RatAB toxin-antitoxin module